MAKVRLPFEGQRNGMVYGCYGLSMADGTRYTVNNRGVIDVENPAHLKAIANNPTVEFSVNGQTGFREVKRKQGGKWCEPCKFHAWDFSSRCPRCQGELVPYDEED